MAESKISNKKTSLKVNEKEKVVTEVVTTNVEQTIPEEEPIDLTTIFTSEELSEFGKMSRSRIIQLYGEEISRANQAEHEAHNKSEKYEKLLQQYTILDAKYKKLLHLYNVLFTDALEN